MSFFFKDVLKGVIIVVICSVGYLLVSTIHHDYIARELVVKLKTSMIDYFKNSDKLKEYNLTVSDVTAIQTGMNQYQANINVSYQGEVHNLTAAVLYDGNMYSWKVDPSELNFLTQSALEKFGRKLMDR